MQKKIDRMPKKAFLPGHLTGEATVPPLGRTRRCEGAMSFAMIARELQAEVWADELVDISDAELPTGQAIRRARLRMQSRQWLAGKYNSRFADKPNQTQVNVGAGVVITEAERVKLLERRDKELLALANQGKSGDSAPIPPEP